MLTAILNSTIGSNNNQVDMNHKNDVEALDALRDK
jgi:hypothetical protein